MQDVPSLRKVHHSYLPLLMLLAQQSPSLGENPLFEKGENTRISIHLTFLLNALGHS